MDMYPFSKKDSVVATGPSNRTLDSCTRSNFTSVVVVVARLRTVVTLRTYDT